MGQIKVTSSRSRLLFAGLAKARETGKADIQGASLQGMKGALKLIRGLAGCKLTDSFISFLKKHGNDFFEIVAAHLVSKFFNPCPVKHFIPRFYQCGQSPRCSADQPHFRRENDGRAANHYNSRVEVS